MHGLFKWSSKWWPGVIPLVVFWGIAAWTSTATVEADLAARSNAALKDTVLDKRRISVDGRDVTFAANAFSEDGRLSAVASVEAVPGVRLVNDETRLVPEAKPFVWSAERDVVRVTLGGNAPLPSSKGKLTEAAKASLGGVEVVDQMVLARGAPSRFDAAALLLLDQIGKLKEGKITLTDNKVALVGMLLLVPNPLREAASALGLPRSLVIKRIAYRAARSGLITGVLLATARVAGETAPLLFTALSNQFFSLDLTKTMANLPVTINNFVQSPYAYWKELAWSGALLITFTVLALNIGARILGAERAAK